MVDHPILLFDGVCNLCVAGIQFIIKRDSKKIFRFASLQSQAGQNLLKKFNLPRGDLDTMILVEGESCYVKSVAGLHIAQRLPFPWPLISVLRMIPEFIRDALYTYIAKNRYRWFGKKNACLIPTENVQERFLE